MNILVPQNWLKDYVKTDAKPADIANALSLHAFSVEKIIETANGEPVFEIEITPNRRDALSVLGIARELKALLPRLGFKAEWPEIKNKKGNETDKLKLDVQIADKSLVPRFSALILEDVEIKDSPDFIKQRLEAVGQRPLNNVIDITNYLMFDKGQPMHAFDYDKIKGAKMILRESRKGEKLITLDGATRELPAGVIVIEDGDSRLIDLCGIMGAQNSEVDQNTKRVLLFVQVYDPVRIRKSSMVLGHRTEAALRFEKGIDFEGVIPALWEATDLMKQYANAKEASKLIDILNVEYETKEVLVDYEKINLVAGIEINKKTVDEILQGLGFELGDQKVKVPSWRYDDIDLPEDLAEEVIRFYGYYKLPNKLLTGDLPKRTRQRLFSLEFTVKIFLKHQGFFECYTNSATSEELAGKGALQIANPLTEEFKYFRTSLLPQLAEVITKNLSYGDRIKVFELASVYLSQEGKLPAQPLRLGLVAKGMEFLEFKGVVEALQKEIGVKDSVDFKIQEQKEDVLMAELDFEELIKKATKIKSYQPLCGFNSIKEDLTLVVPPDGDITYPQIEKIILDSDRRILKLNFKGIYKNFLTLAIEYHDSAKQISSEQTQEIRKKIFEELEKKLGVKLKM
ncbi:phenylalanine--tRNA ligase subunit beta [Patescibacteria group bacterium]|nr:phenylalanine--tRNA ligase subunit beta [Patescibacteria group bacterium]